MRAESLRECLCHNAMHIPAFEIITNIDLCVDADLIYVLTRQINVDHVGEPAAQSESGMVTAIVVVVVVAIIAMR